MTNRALSASRAVLAWVVLTASLVIGGLATSAAPAQAATAATYTVTTSVNVRTGPSESKKILVQLQTGQTVLATGKVKGKWLPITWEGKTAYAWAAYFKRNTKPATVVTAGPTGKKTTTAKVEVRAKASSKGKLIATLKKKAVVRVTGLVSGAYTQISYQSQSRWVLTKKLTRATDTLPDVIGTFTLTDKLAQRAIASVTATNIKTITKGKKVGLTGVHSGSYSQVVYAGKVGWLITGYVKAADSAAKKIVLPRATGVRYVAGDGVVLRNEPSPDATGTATVNRGTALRITGVSQAGFTAVIWNGGTRWVADEQLSATKAIALAVTVTTGVNLGTDSLNKLQPYAKAAVLEIRPLFPQIKTIHGWRSSSDYSDDHPNGRAIDIMIPSYKTNKALGDTIAQWVIANGSRLHVNYVIWQQRSYTIARGTWKTMEDRGSDTANHYDHVHVSFFDSSAS